MDKTTNTNWDTQPHRILHFKDRLAEVGISTIPIQHNTKLPVCNDWQFRDSPDQWDEAVSRYDRNNIGVRAGKLTTKQNLSIVIVDMDNPEAVRNITAQFEGLGLQPTIVKTASGTGRHAYFLVEGVDPHFTYKHLDSKLGKGELRAGRGAYVVAPCSEIEDSVYHFHYGNWETLLIQANPQWEDLLQLLPKETPKIQTPATSIVTATGRSYTLPVTLQYGDMPHYTQNFLQWLSNAAKGDSYKNYSSRSEVEMSVICTLILRGWDMAEVRGTFESYKSGHYMDKGKNRGKYLASSYNKAIAFLADTPIRQKLTLMYQDTMNTAWEGLTGNSDRDTLLAVIAHCYRHDSLAVYAGQRDLAETAASTQRTIGRALKRLQEQEAIIKIKDADKTKRKAALYALVSMPIGKEMSKMTHKSQPQAASSKLDNSGQVANEQLASKLSSIWGTGGGLGKSAKAIYHHLSDQPLSNPDLCKLTGKTTNTVATHLGKLQQYGLTAETDKGFILGEVSLKEICLVLGAEDMGKKPKVRHAIERMLYEASLKRTEKVDVKV